MLDIGWTELLVIGIVALIVVGPKDLPGMFRALGRFTGKAKAMARDFQRAMDQAADDAGMKDVKDMGSSLKKATDPKSMGMDALKDATTGWAKSSDLSDKELGPETSKLAEDRAEAARKIQEATAAKATARKEAEAASTTAQEGQDEAKAETAPAKKAAPRKAAGAGKASSGTGGAGNKTAKAPGAKAKAAKATGAKKKTAKAAPSQDSEK